MMRIERDSDLPNTVSNPLLFTVDDVVLAILGQLSLAGQVCNIGAGIRLGDSQADALVATKDIRKDAVLECLLSVLVDRWATNTEATEDVPHKAARAGS